MTLFPDIARYPLQILLPLPDSLPDVRRAGFGIHQFTLANPRLGVIGDGRAAYACRSSVEYQWATSVPPLGRSCRGRNYGRGALLIDVKWWQ